MPVPVSTRFLETLASSDQHRIATAEIWNKGTKLAYLGTTTDGSVAIDVSQQVRRTCDITINSQGLGLDALIPTRQTDLLHPASGNELRLFRGFQYADGTQELCPLGVFRMTQPKVTDTGDSIAIAVTGNDRAALVTRRAWTDVYPITDGTPLNIALRELINNRVGDLLPTFKFAPTLGLTVPATTFGTSLASSNDPMADAVSLATAASMELFWDYEGALVLQPVPDPSTIAASFASALIYSEGENCTFTEVGRLLDETQSKNGVIVIGTGTGGAPVQAQVWDTDSSSPTYYLGPWGKTPYIYQTSLIPAPGSTPASAQAQALSMAKSLYLRVHTFLDSASFQAVPNPALLESDVVRLVRKRIGLNANYTGAQITMPMDVSTEMSVVARPLGIAA